MSPDEVTAPTRSISEDLGRTFNLQMHGIGVGMFVILGFLALPLLPLLAVGWLVLRAGSAIRRTVSGSGPAEPGDGLRRVRADRRRAVGQRDNSLDTR